MRKKLVCIALCCIMVVGVCGCSKKTQDVESSAAPVDTQQTIVTKDDLAKQGVYHVENINLEEILGTAQGVSVSGWFQAGERIYFTVNMNAGQNVKIFSVKSDGSDAKVTVPVLETAQQTSEENVSHNISYKYYQADMSGRILALKNESYIDAKNPERIVSSDKASVCCWGEDGALIWEAPLQEVQEANGKIRINTLCCLEDGTTAVLVGGGKIGKYILDKDGQVSELQPMGDYGNAFIRTISMEAYTYGKVRIFYMDRDGETQCMANFDVAADQLGEEIQIPQNLLTYGLNNPVIVEGRGLIYNNAEGVFCYRPDQEDKRQIMNFINSDLSIVELMESVPVDDTHIMAFYTGESGETVASLFTEVPASEMPERDVLVLGGVTLEPSLLDRIVDFNRANDQFRIVVRDYRFPDSDDAEEETGYARLNQAILGENIPDIMLLSANAVPVEEYARKGLLVDIGARMEADEEIKGTEYFQNVLDACKIDGVLYEVVPYFGVNTYVGKASIFGERKTWTLQEAAALKEELLKNQADQGNQSGEESEKMFSEISGPEFVVDILSYHGGDFIHTADNKSDFNTEEFIGYLDYASKLPEQVAVSVDDYKYRDEKVYLSEAYLNNLQGVNYLWNGSFGGDMTFVGMPSYQGKGVAFMYANKTFAIAADSDRQDAAWSFVRYYLTEDYQSTLAIHFPVSVKQYDRSAKLAAESDEWTYWGNGEEKEFLTLTQEQADATKAMIRQIDRRIFYDNEIKAILTEETGKGLFSGNRSAKDAANVIQGRVQGYLEKR